ncbi:hypothetical protein F5J12DRAFT_928625 [Pisolithus orientalis]|uniref:uncharacterized protein n=1 Tax=Pisolithus orientalis TaxID=936130 RepID=UPI0022258DF1|nr:uncharacterized protein F5J12DRAFT_928625 [Pisolithus orientalis]KAI5999781.1 hypothetical protein F5J12DRAFT_928625 [Pisolithus orientalis]
MRSTQPTPYSYSSRTRTAVDIEFRESVFRHSAGGKLYEPASDLDAIRHVIDSLTTAPGLPIAAAKMPHFQGTMGFYFKSGDDLCGVTTRHVLFPADEVISDYTYGPRRPLEEVLLMGTEAWDDYLNGDPQRVDQEFGRAAGDSPVAKKAKKELTKTRELLGETINELHELYEQTKKEFGERSQRMIGHVVWSPAITVGTAPHSFTKEVCVVKLNKARFLPKFKGTLST